jgi:hypothetical protein
MKILLIILLLTLAQISYSQIVYNKKNIYEFIDYNNNTLKLSYDLYSIEAGFKIIKVKYDKYIIAKGNDGIHWVIRPSGKSFFHGIDILKGDYEKTLKELKKGRKYRKTEVLFSNLPSYSTMDDFRFITEKEKEKIKSQELKKESVASEIIESGLIGTYNIEILRHDNLDYSKVQTTGKIIITSKGVTIQTQIPTLGLLRGSYWVEQTNPLKRDLVCNVSKGYGDFFTMRLSSSKTAGAFTIMSGSRSQTTTFMVTN